MTQQILSYFQIGVAILLGAAILLQQKGQGLSGAFGGEGGFYRTKRGLEKTLLIATIALVILFIGTGILRVVLTSSPELPVTNPPNDALPAVDGNTITIPEFEINAEPVSPPEGR